MATPTTPRTILLVEDEPTLQRILGSVLNDAGHRVEAVATAEQALERLRDDRSSDVDLVLSDKNLPAMNGLDLLEQVRKGEQPGARSTGFVLVTGYPSRDSAVAVLAADGDGYLVKPFRSLSTAVQDVQRVLDATLAPRRRAASRARAVAALLGGIPSALASGTRAALLDDDRAASAALARAGIAVGGAELVVAADAANLVVIARRIEDLKTARARAPGCGAVLWDAAPSFHDLVELIHGGGGALADPGLLPLDVT